MSDPMTPVARLATYHGYVNPYNTYPATPALIRQDALVAVTRQTVIEELNDATFEVLLLEIRVTDLLREALHPIAGDRWPWKEVP
jgi:hypothetical protein